MTFFDEHKTEVSDLKLRDIILLLSVGMDSQFLKTLQQSLK